MATHRISDDEAAAVLQGTTPGARHDLASVADAVATFRRASLAPPPIPTAVLAARLDLERAVRISASADRTDLPARVSPPVIQAAAPGRRRSVASGALAGLGLAAKIAIGATAATAMGVAGAGAAGAAGILPTEAQVVFEEFTGQPPGAEYVSDSGLEHGESGLETAEEAHQKGEAKREAALETAEEQRQAGLENAANAENAENAEHASEAGRTGLETAEEASETGRETAGDASRNGPEIADQATTENVPPTAVGGPKD